MRPRARWLRVLISCGLLVGYWFACRALTEPAAVAPWLASGVAGLGGLAIFAATFWVVPRRDSEWSIRQRDVQGLVVGLALVASGVAYGASYLDEKTPADVRPPKPISLDVAKARVATLGSRKPEGPPDPFGEHTITLLASVEGCDGPVTLRAAFWPRGGKRVSGAFHWKGDGPVPAADAEELVANPVDGSLSDVPGAVVADRPHDLVQGAPSLTAERPATRAGPVIAEFSRDVLVDRNGRNGCFVRLPAISGGFSKTNGEATTIGRYITVVKTGRGVRLVQDASNPTPITTATGQPAWPCATKEANSCTPPVAAVEDVRSEARVNLTLVVLGAWIGLGFAILIELALDKFRIRRSP